MADHRRGWAAVRAGLALVAIIAVATGCSQGNSASDDPANPAEVGSPSSQVGGVTNTTYIGNSTRPSDFVGPEGIVRPPNQAPPSTDAAGNPIPPSVTTIPGPATTPPQSPTTVEEFTRFRCVVSVTPFLGGTSGESRRVKVSIRLSSKTVPIVWATTSWDDKSETSAVTLNPDGQIEFLVFAPGSSWPVSRIFATPDRRATSQMCTSG